MKALLVIEGNEQQRLMVEKILKMHSEKVFSTRDCAEALELQRNNVLDMAIVDLDTKPGECVDFVRALRDADPEKRTYIIVGTDEGDTTNILDILEAGANEFISKPYERSVLEAKILLGKRVGYSGDAISVLTEEHRAILRAVRILNYISDKLAVKDISKTLLKWVTSTSFLLDSDLHHKKEEHFIISFLEGAIKFRSEMDDPTIFSRSSLKTIENEHADLIRLKKDIQMNITLHTQLNSVESRDKLRTSINDYIQLLKDHMTREEQFLFPAARPLISQEENVRLLREFQNIEIEIGIEEIDKRISLLLEAESYIERNLEKRSKLPAPKGAGVNA